MEKFTEQCNMVQELFHRKEDYVLNINLCVKFV